MPSMSAYLPPSSGEGAAINSLLEVISNPKEAKAALQKIVDERQALEAATERFKQVEAATIAAEKKAAAEHKKAQDEIDKKASQAASDLGAAKGVLAKAEQLRSESEQTDKKLAVMRTAIQMRESRLDEIEKELSSKLQQVGVREVRCEEHERAMEKREAQLAAREKALADDIEENTRWLLTLKPPRPR